mgnify:CR=1 FL=1
MALEAALLGGHAAGQDGDDARAANLITADCNARLREMALLATSRFGPAAASPQLGAAAPSRNEQRPLPVSHMAHFRELVRAAAPPHSNLI